MTEVDYLIAPDLPRILLFACSDDLYEALTLDRYSVTRAAPDATFLFTLHEKDLLIIDTAGFEALTDLFSGVNVIGARKKLLAPFASAYARGGQVLCLSDLRPLPHPALGRFDWVPKSDIYSSTLVFDQHLRLTQDCNEKFPELATLFQDYRDELKAPMVLGYSRAWPLLENDARQVKALYEPIEQGGVLFLPHVERQTAFVRRLLREVLPRLSPALFPPRDDEWLDADEYQSAAALAARRKIREADEAHQRKRQELMIEEEAARTQHAPILAILTSESHDLRLAIKQALESLEFEEVVDVDMVRAEEGISPEEDLQVKDGDYFAVVEVTGGKGNARERDFQDLLKYQHRRMKDPGRTDIDPLQIQGLLIMNQHMTLEPLRRPRLFESNEHDYPKQAEEMGVTLLSTWDLFQILRAVDDGQLSKTDARLMIRQPGLVNASTLGVQPSSPASSG
jgi:hypothetical protein